jgi:putative transposase
MKQLEFHLPQRGGKRKNAGRKPNGAKALVSHDARPKFARPTPALVTLRVANHVWSLRSGRSFRRIAAAFEKARGKFGMRLIEFSVMGNHLHLIVEADDSSSLSRGMQGLNIRIAKALNRMMDRKGSVFADHFHSRLLRSPTELTIAIAYVLGNAAKHFGETFLDVYSSIAPRAREYLGEPRSWLLRNFNRRELALPG